jgi:8-oxo-dGTP diphosphatase
MIESKFTGHSGVEYIFQYHEADTFENMDNEKCTQVYSVLFVDEKMVVVHNGKKGTWGMPGGTIEEGETFLETLSRETIEEANVKITSAKPVGYQKVIDTRDGSFVYQLRYVSCGTKIAEFVSDPAGSISEVAYIEPKDVKQYFDWGEIGDAIVKRALILKDTL